MAAAEYWDSVSFSGQGLKAVVTGQATLRVMSCNVSDRTTRYGESRHHNVCLRQVLRTSRCRNFGSRREEELIHHPGTLAPANYQEQHQLDWEYNPG